jgi:formylglycine-generating enzyme required for sulfatase activity
MVGNVWEWVRADVVEGVFDDVTLPETGYVSSVDTKGTPRSSSTTAPVEFNADYVWVLREEGVYAVMRGGYYDSGTDAGVYAFHAGILPTTPGIAIGFRCVK